MHANVGADPMRDETGVISYSGFNEIKRCDAPLQVALMIGFGPAEPGLLEGSEHIKAFN